MQAPALDYLPFIGLFLVTLCVLGVVAWRGRVRERKFERKIHTIEEQLDASFSFSGRLLEAQDEKTVIFGAMHAGGNLLDADGYAFVPFNELEQRVPALQFGDLPFLSESDWQIRLSEAVTRHTCRNCANREAGSECILLRETPGAEHVHCVALRCGGREVGMINYFFSEQPQITEEQKLFLDHMVRMTDLALDSMRAHTQELDAVRAAQQSIVSNKELSAESQEILEQLKYQAVLDERTRLAREIHDGLAQTLAFLKMEAARLQTHVTKRETASLTEALQAYYQTLSDAYLDTRQAIDNLRRVPDENLAEWLELTASDFGTLTGLTVDVSNVELAYAFPNNIKVQLIRIVQEALTNVRKHARACTVSISAFERGREAVIEVKDNGCGFAPEDVDRVAQYGLRGMRERAESIGADFQVISAPGMGTTIRLQIPIREKANP